LWHSSALAVVMPQQVRVCRLDRQPAEIHAVEFEQVEGAEHGSVVVTPGAEQSKDRERYRR
jgi:hypothetical protein